MPNYAQKCTIMHTHAHYCIAHQGMRVQLPKKQFGWSCTSGNQMTAEISVCFVYWHRDDNLKENVKIGMNHVFHKPLINSATYWWRIKIDTSPFRQYRFVRCTSLFVLLNLWRIWTLLYVDLVSFVIRIFFKLAGSEQTLNRIIIVIISKKL